MTKQLLVGWLTALILGAASAVAQQRTAHPQDTDAFGSGSTNPLGVWISGTLGEARTQFLIPSHELPAVPATLVGFEVLPIAPVTLNYSQLGITCSPSSLTALGLSFAANLAGSPTVVLPLASRTVQYGTSWTPVLFTTPYQHDGHSGLVIDIRKRVATGNPLAFTGHRGVSIPLRDDRPLMVTVGGTSGSGASQATVATDTVPPITLRLLWQQVPTLRHTAAVGPSGNQCGLGNTVALTVEGMPGHLFVMVAGIDWLPGYPLAGVQGEFRLVARYTFEDGTLDAQGRGSYLVQIPNLPALVGLRVVYQAATLDPVTGVVVLTNGTDHFVNA
jgi:hypothetical protein